MVSRYTTINDNTMIHNYHGNDLIFKILLIVASNIKKLSLL